MPLYPFIAALVLATLTATARAQDPGFRAEVRPAYAAAPEYPPARRDPRSRPRDGFSGAFGVRSTVRNLGY